jgi:hypothetical protein
LCVLSRASSFLRHLNFVIPVPVPVPVLRPLPSALLSLTSDFATPPSSHVTFTSRTKITNTLPRTTYTTTHRQHFAPPCNTANYVAQPALRHPLFLVLCPLSSVLWTSDLCPLPSTPAPCPFAPSPMTAPTPHPSPPPIRSNSAALPSSAPTASPPSTSSPPASAVASLPGRSVVPQPSPAPPPAIPTLRPTRQAESTSKPNSAHPQGRRNAATACAARPRTQNIRTTPGDPLTSSRPQIWLFVATSTPPQKLSQTRDSAVQEFEPHTPHDKNPNRFNILT